MQVNEQLVSELHTQLLESKSVIKKMEEKILSLEAITSSMKIELDTSQNRLVLAMEEIVDIQKIADKTAHVIQRTLITNEEYETKKRVKAILTFIQTEDWYSQLDFDEQNALQNVMNTL